MGLLDFLFAGAVKNANRSHNSLHRSNSDNYGYDRGYEDGYDDSWVDQHCGNCDYQDYYHENDNSNGEFD